MRAGPYLFFTVLALALAPMEMGCSEETESKPTGPDKQPCNKEADCDDNNPCTFDFCISNFCTNDTLGNGEAPDDDTEQIPGDCFKIACVDGEVGQVVVNQDLPDDPNDVDCTIPSCSAEGVPGTVEAADGEYCENSGSEAVCSAGAVCSCAPPTAGSTVFVNAAEGTDVPGNGGAPGACAYASIGYALTQATGEIRLTFEDYTTETFPLVLTGAQWINCPFDQDNNNRPRISGSGLYNGVTAVVVFEGSTNEVDDCELDAANTADYGVIVASAAMGGDHVLDHVVISNAVLDGVWVNDLGDRLTVEDESMITGNGGYGVNFAAPDKQGSFDNSTTAGNTAGGVNCAALSPQVEFQGGTLGTCTGCQNCP
jgi:hypothetical protein